jgi:hypothetical protein
MEPNSGVVVPVVKSFVYRVLIGAAAAVLLATSAFPAPTDILPAGQVTAGMRGYGLSDLGDGKGVQRFEVEIVGVLKSYAPKQDLILARILNDEALAKSGIIAGMSGSPVYVDGKLIGALAYGWPFARDPICGITPIQSMLDIRKAPATPPVPIGGAATSTKVMVSAFGNAKFAEPFTALVNAFHGQPASGNGPVALPLPVSFSGLTTPGTVFGRVAEAAGWLVAPSGASSPSAGAAGPEPEGRLEPGSAVAAVLLNGDMVLSATGTVTWVDGNSILAFGHPFLSMGPVDMPMARADVLTVLPSLYRSFKFSTTGPALGSVSQDRSSGILGSFGKPPTMVPVTIKMTSEDLPPQTFRFEVVHNSMLTPILLAMATDNVLTTLEKRAGERTIVWKSSIATDDKPVRWDSVFSGLTAREEAVGSLALLTNYLMANEFRDLSIRGVEVEITHSDRLQSARIVNVEAQKERVRPGDTVPVWVDLEDFRGGSRPRRHDGRRSPENTPPGPLTLFDGCRKRGDCSYDLALYRPIRTRTIRLLESCLGVRPPPQLNLLAYRAGRRCRGQRRAPAGAAADAGRPAARISRPGRRTRRDLGIPARLQAESIEQPVPVSGSARLHLEVLPRIW